MIFVESKKTSLQEWISRRTAAVRDVYSAYQCLTENGVELPDEDLAYQISCVLPTHGADTKPSSRYYPRSGTKHDHFFCFKCRVQLDSISLFSRFHNIKFMEGLATLEKRFRIKIPKKPDGPTIIEPVDRDSNYISTEWSDVPRVLAMMEKKLLRIRNKVSQPDFIKFCRVLDAIDFDFEKIGKPIPQIVDGLRMTMTRMDEVASLPDILNDSEVLPDVK